MPFFIISRSEMMKNGVYSKQLLAAKAAKGCFFETPLY
jgi:hypothetical protein